MFQGANDQFDAGYATLRLCW